MKDWFNNLTQSIGTGASNLSAGAGNVIGDLITPAGGFLNNVLGQTVNTTTTTNAPDASAQSNTKTLTIVIVVVSVIAMVIVGVLVLRSSKTAS